MKIDFEDILQMVNESVKKILSEGVSEVTYHFTSLQNCISILKNNAIHLTMSSNKADAYDNKRLFYLSTQRSRNKEIGYAGHLGSCVRIQLNGEKIMYNHTGKPIDYWGNSMGKQSYYRDDHNSIYGTGFNRSRQTHHNFEMEDRIFSYEPTIDNASNFINRIDVYVDSRTDRLQQTKIEKYRQEIEERVNEDKDLAITVYILSKHNKIPVYIYNNLKDFNYMTENTINDEISELYKNDYHHRTEMKYDDYDRYKISKNVLKQNKFVYILYHLFNVLTDGKLNRGDKNMYKTVNITLKKFGLEKYANDVINSINHSWGSDFNESCMLLSNTINAPIRKLNSEYPDDDSNKIMKFGAYILKQKGASNFDDLKYR